MFYFISNSEFITEDIIKSIDFKNGDKIFLFGKKCHRLIYFILDYIERDCNSKIDVVLVQRETAKEREYFYRGSSFDFVKDKRIKSFYLISGGAAEKLDYDIDYSSKSIRRHTKNDFKKYKSYLLETDHNREVHFINYKSILPPYGMGYNIFGIKYYEPYTGFITLLYFDNKFPNEKKTLVGFTAYSEISRNRPLDVPTHRSRLEYELLLSYCKNRDINIIFSKIYNKKLLNEDVIKDFKPMFLINGTIDIESADSPKNITKSSDFYKRASLLTD